MNSQVGQKVGNTEVGPTRVHRARAVSISGNALWNMGATAFSMVALFLLTPFLVRYLGDENYGIFLFLATFSGVLGLANLGAGEATLRFVAFYSSRGDPEGINRVFAASLFVAVACGGFVAFSAIAFCPWFIGALKFSSMGPEQAVFLLRITAITFWFRLLAGCFLSIPQALLRYDLYSKVMVAETILRTLGSFAVVMFGWGLTGLAVLTLCLSLCLLPVSIGVARHLEHRLAPFQRPSRAGLREVFGYGIFAFASQLVGIAWQYADRVLLGIFVSASAIAYFAVPQDLSGRLLTLLAAAPAAALMPKFAGISDPAKLRSLYLQSISVFLSISIVVFVPATVFIKDFLTLWISPDFAAQGGLIGMLLCGSTMIRGAFLPQEALFRGIGRPHYILGITTLSAVTVLGLDLLLIPRMGLLGAGYALCVSPVWGIAAVAFSVTRLLGGVSLTEILRSFVVPVFIGFACLGAGLFLRSCLPEHLGWVRLLLGSGGLLAITAIVLIVYEVTMCRGNCSFVFFRTLLRFVPERFLSYANPA